MSIPAIAIQPISPADAQVQQLMNQLDAFQVELYGRENCHLDSVEVLVQSGAYMLGAFSGKTLVGMGAIKIMSHYAEVKRMYVDEHYRGLRIAERILTQLEDYAKAQHIISIKLETGIYHHAAQALYRKMGYQPIEAFGGYPNNGLSIFLGKSLE